MVSLKQKLIDIRPELAKAVGRENFLSLPRIIKVVVSARTGRQRDKARQALVSDRLAKITGQKPAAVAARQSIATFKLRKGETIGWRVTLRGERRFDFLDRLLNIAVPRMRDFRGFEEKSVSATGVLTLGLREHTIFPETANEDLKDVFGLAVSVVTTARNRDEALIFLRLLGFPFKR